APPLAPTDAASPPPAWRSHPRAEPHLAVPPATHPTGPGGPPMKVVIPLFDRFTALDAIGPYEVLTKVPGAEVTFVAAEAGPVTADTGVLTVQVGTSLAEVPEADVLVVPGGPGTRTMMGD